LAKKLARVFGAIHPVVTEYVLLQLLFRETISQGQSEKEPLVEYEDIPIGEKLSRWHDTIITVFQ
jgi:hypothetical protein